MYAANNLNSSEKYAVADRGLQGTSLQGVWGGASGGAGAKTRPVNAVVGRGVYNSWEKNKIEGGKRERERLDFILSLPSSLLVPGSLQFTTPLSIRVTPPPRKRADNLMSSYLPSRREREQMRAILGQHINAAVHAQGVGVPRRNAAPLEAWLERQGIWRWSARRPSMAGTKSRRGCSLSAKTKGREARVAGLGSGT